MAPPGDNGGGLERGDLIRPTGALLKFIHSDDPDDKTGPMFEASFEVRGEGKAGGRESSHQGGSGREACVLLRAFWVVLLLVLLFLLLPGRFRFFVGPSLV